MESGGTKIQSTTSTAPAAHPLPPSSDKQSNSNTSSDKCIEQTETVKTSSDTQTIESSGCRRIASVVDDSIAFKAPGLKSATGEFVQSDFSDCVTAAPASSSLSSLSLLQPVNLCVTNNTMPLTNGTSSAVMNSSSNCVVDGQRGNGNSGTLVVDQKCSDTNGGESVEPETILSNCSSADGGRTDAAAAGDGIWDQNTSLPYTSDSVVSNDFDLLNKNACLSNEFICPLTSAAAVAASTVPSSVPLSHSISGLIGLGAGKTLNDVAEEDEEDDEDGSESRTERADDIKPLLSAEDNEKRKPTKGIVKSPSTKSFGHESSPDSAILERPVLHVKFHPNDGLPNIYPGFGDQTSPASSVTSTSSSSSDDEESSSGQYSEAKPPDGGWGWVVVFASFVVNLIADGITFSFGVIYVEFLNYFGEGKGKTAWIGSLFMAMPLLSGPIASFLTDRYGCRKVTIAGSILACLGFVMSAFSSSMEMLFLTFGIIAGFGLSLCYVAAVVIVAYYFDKRRSFATGLSVCGSGIGTFIFAPLTQVLIENYGWRGTTLILAGFFLNMTVCGMLMRDLEWTTHRAKLKAKQRKKNKLGISAESFSVSNSTNTGGTASNLNQVPFNIGGLEDPNVNPRMFSSLITLPTFMRNGEKIPPEVLELMASHRNAPQAMAPTLSHSRSFSEPLSNSRLSNVALSPPEGALSPTNPERQRFEKTKTRQIQNEQAFMSWLSQGAATNNPNQRDTTNRHPTSAYLKDLKMHRHSLTYRGAMLNINRYRLRASSCPDIYRNSMTTIAKEKFQWGEGIQEFKNLFTDMLDFSYFADVRFLLFALSNFFLYTWYDVPYVYLADNAIGLNISETDASMLISAIGIVNMFGEIFLGWCGDKKYMTAGVIYAICMGLCGIVTALVPLSKTFGELAFISGLFGLFIAANYALTSIILVELITLDRFTNAYGLLLLVQGIANLIGPPVAGWITDVTGNYDLAFYISGFFIAVSGGLMFILPVQGKLKKYQTLKKEKNAARDALSSNQIIRDEKLQNGGKANMFSDCFGKDNENHV